MTKQEQKDEAYEDYEAIIDQAFKAHEAIIDQAYKTYKAIRDQAFKAHEDMIDQAFKAYLAKCKEIDAQEDEIKIIDGKRYKLIN